MKVMMIMILTQTKKITMMTTRTQTMTQMLTLTTPMPMTMTMTVPMNTIQRNKKMYDNEYDSHEKLQRRSDDVMVATMTAKMPMT